ncbi:DNA-binding transcriptional LysR family regulator [Novosphingobium chloroacetimidivorans]|uniref:DNA-binding transcriptional LysR family regulator n=1 Tax=Novosphingobium chloroacetimidivorans TaxID=1428314 RepID=A0A7W7NXK3_9SPHN|nr:DNA-binding transcriptional LysR family regulator [Novosphingobium chloroacetimidivorans]
MALSHTLNYVRAAERLGLSQSALTRSIQAVERECGSRLFDRDRGGVSLTRAGAAFVERASALLAGADDLATFMQRTALLEEGEIAFGMEPLVARALLAPVLSDAIAAAPAWRNRVAIRSIEALSPMLKAGEIDFFVSAESGLSQDPAIRAERLGAFPLSLLVRAGHPALTNLDDEGPYPVLLAGEAGTFTHLPARVTRLISGPRHIVEDYDILAKLTQATDAILIASAVAVRPQMAQGLVEEIPVGDRARVTMPIMIYTLARRSRSPAMLKLGEALRAAMRGVADDRPG